MTKITAQADQRRMAGSCQEHGCQWPQGLALMLLERDRSRDFIDWLISMDDPEDVLGRADRQTVTLTKIIERARAAISCAPDDSQNDQGG